MMTNKNAQKIQDILKAKGIDTKIVEFSESTRTAQEAAVAIGCTVAQIVKSLIFMTKETNKPILVLVSGINRVNEKHIAALIGEKIGKADADFVREVTGYAIGGVAPIGHTQIIDTYIDEDLLQFDEIWAAAGTPRSVFKLASKDLVNLTHGKVVGVK